MKHEYREHNAFIGDWFGPAARGLDCDQTLELLQLAVRAVWRSAQTSVSDITLDAVLERVVINARDHFPWLPALPIVHGSIDASVWRAHCGRSKLAETQAAVRFIITEFVAINANLTAGTLTQGMQRALSKVRWTKKNRDSRKSGENKK